MFSHHLLCICFKQKKQQSFLTLLSFLCFVLLGSFSHAKEKITTPHFTILFDKSAANSANHIANTLETIYKPVCKTLGVYPSSMCLVVNNRSTELNGYFKPIPRHIYFYTLCHPDPYFIGNTDWLSMLSIHEFRHAAQHSIEYRSTPFWLKPLYFGAGLISVCGVNHFFKEGDAVGIETALSKSGRGRLCSWEKIYKVNLLEHGTVDFASQVFGSSKHDMPSEYHLGYYFTTHIRRKYGKDAIKSIFEKTVRGMPYLGFYHAIKKVTKKSIGQVYKEMNEELRLSWQKQLAGLKITPAVQVTVKKPNERFDYTHPFMDASGNLMAWKTGTSLRPKLVQVGATLCAPTTSKKNFSSFRKDKTIFYFIQGTPLPPAAFSIGEGCAAWLETCTHPWQGHKKTIRLQYYDFKKRKRRTLVSSSNYTALAMSPSSQQLVAVTTNQTGKQLLVVLETQSGKVVKKIDNPDQGCYLTPSWSGENHIIVVKTKNQQNSILRINVATSEEEILLPYTYEHRSYPKIYKDYLLYNSSYNGIDNIYAMHLPTKACFQITSRKYGAYLGMVDAINNQLIFNDYTKNGMDIAVMPFDPTLWTPLEEVEDRSIRYYEPLVQQEENNDILAKVPNQLYPLSRYNAAKDNLAFIGLSVAPNLGDRGLKIEPFTVVNFQETLKITPYYYQNFNILGKDRDIAYKTSELGLKVKCTAWYPMLTVDIKGSRHKSQGIIEQIRNIEEVKQLKVYHPAQYNTLFGDIGDISDPYWTQELNLGIRLPYYFTLGSSTGSAYFKATVDFIRSKQKTDYSASTYSFNIQNYSTKCKKDINAPWSQELNIYFTDFNLLGTWKNITHFAATFGIPAICNHHYFKLTPNIERRTPLTPKLKQYIKQHILQHTILATKPSWVWQIQLAYGLPLAYPECGIPFLWFLEKIWMEGYYHSKSRKINQADKIFMNNHDTIGIKVWSKSRLLSNKNIPYLTASIDFPFLKKEDNGWKFDYRSLDFSIQFHLEHSQGDDFTKNH